MKFEPVYLSSDYAEKRLTTAKMNRPGLQLAGYYEHFTEERLQLIGKMESAFLDGLDSEDRFDKYADLMITKVPAIVFCHGLEPHKECIEAAKEFNVTIFKTDTATSEVINRLLEILNNYLAPRITRHGVLVEVYGEGMLILGDSGIGKSETAIELVKRGHRLIADDAVEIKRVSAKTLVGSAPELIRYFIELRGIGIVDVRRLFGMGAVKATERIDLVINLEPWDSEKIYDRFGLDEETIDILGIEIPQMTIPVRPGRNLAIILETAAMNNRQKKMGYNTAEEFNKRLMEGME